jgi:hypothetical protein
LFLYYWLYIHLYSALYYKLYTQSRAPEDGRNYRPKHVELIGIINKPLLLHLFDCLYYLYQWGMVKQISYSVYVLCLYHIGNQIDSLMQQHLSDAWNQQFEPSFSFVHDAFEARNIPDDKYLQQLTYPRPPSNF